MCAYKRFLKSSTLLAFWIIFSPISNILAQSPATYNNKSVTQVYEKGFKDLDSLRQLGLMQSEKDLAGKIKMEAIKDGQIGYYTKALNRESFCTGELSDYEEKNAVLYAFMKRELQSTQLAFKAVAHLSMANLLVTSFHTYFSENTVYVDTSADFSQWSKDYLSSQIREHILKSLILSEGVSFNSTLLPLVGNQMDSSEVKIPLSLKAMIAESAIDILKNISNLENLKLNDAQITTLFSDADAFVDLNISAIAVNDELRQILYLYQILIKESKVYHNLKRINYVHTLVSGRDSNYIQALLKLYNMHPKNELSLFVLKDIANFYMDSDRVQALKYLNDGISKFESSLYINTIKNIKLEILRKDIQVTTESLYPPSKSSASGRLLIQASLRNIDTLEFSLYKVNYTDYMDYVMESKRRSVWNYDNEGLYDFIRRQGRLTYTHIQAVPNRMDYFQHSYTLAIPGLSAGIYFMTTKSYKSPEGSGVICINKFSVSTMLPVMADGKLRLLHAETGQPIKNYKLLAINIQNGLRHHLTSNIKGEVNLDGLQEYLAYTILPEDGSFFYVINPVRDWRNNVFHGIKGTILTDRAIYRPGQKVSFKGIVYDDYEYKILKGESLMINLYRNGVVIDTMRLKTNEYGSVSGSYMLPSAGLGNGEYYLSMNIGESILSSRSFRVESYKRPKFKVDVMAPDSSYKLDDYITVKGKATAFAGFAIDNAKVVYSIQRQSRSFYGRYYVPARIIESGEVLTLSDGSFSIRFKAIKSENETQKYLSYNFVVNVQVIDVSGEVQSGSKVITIGNTDREISISGQSMIVSGNAYEAKYEVKSLSGSVLPFTGNIKLYRVIKDKEPLKVPLWIQSEISALNKTDSIILMKDYTFKPQLVQLVEVRTFQFNSSGAQSLLLNKSILDNTGEYRLVMNCVLKPGDTMSSSLDFRILPGRKKKAEFDKNIEVYTSEIGAFQPGETAFLQIRSAVKNLTVFYDISNKKGTKKSGLIQLKKGYAELVLPITEEDRGNVSVHVYSVNQYRDNYITYEIQVPYSNKILDLDLHTFRSDLIPGGKEIWKVKVNANQLDLASTEIAAVLYDASLDELYKDDNWKYWIYYDYSHYFSYTGNQFLRNGSNAYSTLSTYKEIYQITYPKFETYSIYRFSNRYFWDYGDDDYAMGYVSLNVGKMGAIKGFEPSNKMKEIAQNEQSPQAIIRKNFDETAFFLPHLYPDKDSLVSMEFTVPELNTTWHLKMLAHSKNMQLGELEAMAKSNKQLMIQPNLPRFIREKDQMSLSAKVVNTSDQNISLIVKLCIRNAETNEILQWIKGDSLIKLTVPKGQNQVVSFSVVIPEYTEPVIITFSAGNEQFSDGEEHIIPVLSNRTLVYASLPISVRKSGIQNLEFSAMKAASSPTLRTKQLTVEMSNQPAWLAVLSLPYLMDYPNECAEQLFSRIYANSIANNIISSNKIIADYFESWMNKDNSPKSRWNQNEDLKSVLISETPWALEAKNEDERLQQLAGAFNQRKLGEQIKANLEKLSQMQLSDGSFPWFSGMNGNAYITQTLVIGFNKLRHLGIDLSSEIRVKDAQNSLSDFAMKDYLRIKNSKSQFCEPIQVGYLYARSFYTSPEELELDSVLQYFLKTAKKNWLQLSLMNKAQLAIAVHRLEPSSELPKQILRSLKETSKQTDLMGMYWPSNTAGWYWYQAPIETQAAIIEAYSEIEPDRQLISAMQVWLLRHKQTHAWPSSRSTADACYVLLKDGQLTAGKQEVKVFFNQKEVVPVQKNALGYWKQNLDVKAVNSNSSNIKVEASSDDFAFGAIHWQYFENMDKVIPNSAGLSIIRVYYVERIINGKTVNKELKTGDTLRKGDLLKVVLFVRSDRALEFVHVKDQRPSAAEPKDVLSTYKWNNTLSYYQSVNDATFNFFIESMPKGMHQLSYQVSIQQTGIFECGIASAMCLYAPEFTANSSGFKMMVTE